MKTIQRQTQKQSDYNKSVKAYKKNIIAQKIDWAKLYTETNRKGSRLFCKREKEEIGIKTEERMLT